MNSSFVKAHTITTPKVDYSIMIKTALKKALQPIVIPKKNHINKDNDVEWL